MRYAALLRGVNVGGITMKMADVKETFVAAGYDNVKTVLASGNVLFDSDDSPDRLKPAIEAMLETAFGYGAWVHVYEVATIRALIDAYPFEPDREGWHAYVIFTLEPEPREDLLALADELDPALERIAPGDGVVYWTVQRGHTLDSRMGKETGKPRYKQLTTTRNVRTLRKLVA